MIEAIAYGVTVFLCILGLNTLVVLVLLHIFKTDKNTFILMHCNHNKDKCMICNSVFNARLINIAFLNLFNNTLYIYDENSDLSDVNKFMYLSDNNTEIVFVSLKELISILSRRE